jgi:hypothetical protein
MIARVPNLYSAIPGCNNSIETQRRVLSLLGAGMTRLEIASVLELPYQQIAQIADRGVVFVQGVSKPVRCPGCGGKLVALPCVSCEVHAIGLRANSVEGLG